MTVIPTILVQSKLVHQLYIMSTSWFTSITSCDVKFSPGFDWSTATKLKPKFETAQNATFSLANIFFSNPGVGVFLFCKKTSSVIVAGHGDENGCRAAFWAREHLLAPAKL